MQGPAQLQDEAGADAEFDGIHGQTNDDGEMKSFARHDKGIAGRCLVGD
jgi:hypothetical protein